MKRLKTIVGILIRDISRSLSEQQLVKHQETFDLFTKVINQKQKDSNKVYSLHESHIYAIAKDEIRKTNGNCLPFVGSEPKSMDECPDDGVHIYEYGTKASLVTTKDSGIIIGVASHPTNEHDSKTLEAALSSANKHRTKPIIEAICDRGYRGKREVNGTIICIPGIPLKRDTKYQKEQKRKKFRRRAAIEPIIGHLKSDHRLSRNYTLKGFIGDEINLLLAAAVFNFKKWMNNFLAVLFCTKSYYLASYLQEIEAKERRKYADLYLLWFRVW